MGCSTWTQVSHVLCSCTPTTCFISIWSDTALVSSPVLPTFAVGIGFARAWASWSSKQRYDFQNEALWETVHILNIIILTKTERKRHKNNLVRFRKRLWFGPKSRVCLTHPSTPSRSLYYVTWLQQRVKNKNNTRWVHIEMTLEGVVWVMISSVGPLMTWEWERADTYHPSWSWWWKHTTFRINPGSNCVYYLCPKSWGCCRSVLV